MISCIFLKPESVGKEQEVMDGVNLIGEFVRDEESRQLIDKISSSVSVLIEGKCDNQDCLYAGEGIITEKLLFDVLYPTAKFKPDIIDKMKEQYVGKKYKITFFNIETQTQETEVYGKLQQIKGKMSKLGPMYSTGLRGYMFRKSIENGSQNYDKSGNFVHIPDTEEETLMILDYVMSRFDHRSDINSLNTIMHNTTNATNIYLSRKREFGTLFDKETTTLPKHELEVAV